MNDPSVSVSVGLTISPKPFESIRVDLEFQNVLLDGSNLEQTLDASGPIVERLFAAALGKLEREINHIQAIRYDEQPDGAVFPDAEDSPPQRPSGRQWGTREGLALD